MVRQGYPPDNLVDSSIYPWGERNNKIEMCFIVITLNNIFDSHFASDNYIQRRDGGGVEEETEVLNVPQLIFSQLFPIKKLMLTSFLKKMQLLILDSESFATFNKKLKSQQHLN